MNFEKQGDAAKEYLNGYKKSCREVAYIEECIRNESISSKEGRIKKNREHGKQNDIAHKIFKLKEPMEGILYRRYILGEKLEDIAEKMNYNYSYVRRMHREGLKKIEEIMKEELKELGVRSEE